MRTEGCVYLLKDPETRDCYVGETGKNATARMFEHLAEAFHIPKRRHGFVNEGKQKWLRSLFARGQLPIIQILETNSIKGERLRLEAFHILRLRDEGFDVWNANLSAIALEVQNRPDVIAAQIAAQRIAQNRPDVSRRKSESVKKTKSSPEWRAWKHEREGNPIIKKRRIAAATKQNADPAMRARKSAKMRAVNALKRHEISRWEDDGGKPV